MVDIKHYAQVLCTLILYGATNRESFSLTLKEFILHQRLFSNAYSFVKIKLITFANLKIEDIDNTGLNC